MALGSENAEFACTQELCHKKYIMFNVKWHYASLLEVDVENSLLFRSHSSDGLMVNTLFVRQLCHGALAPSLEVFVPAICLETAPCLYWQN